MKKSAYRISTKWIYSIIALFFAILPLTHAYGQIKKYEKLHCIGRNTFNFIPNAKERPSVHKNKDLLIVYSDRDGNKVYANRFAQRVLSEQKMGSPYYVINEKNGFCKVVAASQDIIGKPKGMLGVFHGSKRHLKDARTAPFVGWIPKERLLTFGHAFVSTSNNAPIRYRIGAASAEQLFNLHPYCQADTVSVFRDPFFYDKNGQSVIWGQIVYAYKYDKSKQAVLISDRPTLNDPSRKVLGWIPGNLIAEVGQNHSFLLNQEKTNSGIPLQSDLLFALNGNRENGANRINLPISVWDMDKSKIINIKGGSFPVSEIKRMYNGSKQLNVHLLFFEKDIADVKALASTLQSIALKIPQTVHTRFSITSVSDNGNRHLKCTADYSQWLAFLEKITSDRMGIPVSGAGFHSAFDTIFEESSYVKFGNNVFIILGTDEFPTFTLAIKSKLAVRSSSLLFAQMSSQESLAYQNFVLQAKELLDDNISGYMNFITGYIADPQWDKPSLFKDMSTDDENAYLLDVPQNSVASGGLVYPKTNGKLSNPGFSKILDSLFIQIETKDKELIASLTEYKNKLGVQRAVPTDYITERCEASDLSVAELDRSCINEALYADTLLNDSALSGTADGYLFDADEMKNLLGGYRDLMLYFTSDMGKKEIRTLRKAYRRQSKELNDLYHRKVLFRKSSVSDLFYYKTGIPSSESLNNVVRIKDLSRRKCNVTRWDDCYLRMYGKLVRLEERFKSQKIRTIEIAGTTYYFVPKQEVL